MHTKVILGALLVLLLGTLSFAYMSRTSYQTTPPATNTADASEAVSSSKAITTTAPAKTSNPPQTPTKNGYTMAQVAAHNSGSSCWTAINGSVYDVTSWINRHPGGPEAILSLCGTDGSQAFNGQHGGQRRPESELATFRIGALAQ